MRAPTILEPGSPRLRRPRASRPSLAALAGAPFRSATLRLTLLYAAAGVAFMLANLVLARVLPVEGFAAVALAIALIGFGGLLGPLGQERVVVRRDLAASAGLLARGFAASAAVGLGVAAAGRLLYGLDWTTAALLLTGSTGYGMGILAAAKLQSERRFVLATLVSQGSSPILLLAAVLLAAAGAGTAAAAPALATGLFVAGIVAISVLAWRRLMAAADAGAAPPYRIDWSETLALTGLSGMAALSSTIERLLIPLALAPGALAEFAVLASVVVAPMRMLQMAAQRTLTPRLRDASSAAARRRLLLREAAAVGGLTLLASATLWFAARPALALALGGKYVLTPALVAAALASGAVRVASGLAMATVTALVPRGRLHLVNAAGWLSLLLAVPAAWAGAAWAGLAGLVLGIAAAGLAQVAVLFLLVLPQLRDGAFPGSPAPVAEVSAATEAPATTPSVEPRPTRG